MINKSEAAIIMAYTGVNMGCMDEYYKYLQRIMGRPVFTHELQSLQPEIKEKAKPDFLKLCDSLTRKIPGTKKSRIVDGVKIRTQSQDVSECDYFIVEAGTNGYQGGDTGHGGRTYLRMENNGGLDFNVVPIAKRFSTGVEITLGGDWELGYFIDALKFAVDVLDRQKGCVPKLPFT